MPSITFTENEIVRKQIITSANPANGQAYVGRSTCKMIASGEVEAVLILIRKE